MCFNFEATGLESTALHENTTEGSKSIELLPHQAMQKHLLGLTVQNRLLTPGSRAMTVQVTQTQVRTQPCFLEYLAQGARLCLLFAVDFSGCNPEPSSPACMHHFPQGDATPCEAVMACFADLLMVRASVGESVSCAWPMHQRSSLAALLFFLMHA